MSKPTGPLFIGELIAFHRRQRRWTQAGLAMRLHRSVQWVKATESGRRPIDSISTLTQVAEVLGVPLGALLGKPIAPLPERPEMPEPGRVLLELERVLHHYDGIHGFGAPADRPPRPLAELEREWLRAEELFHDTASNLSGIVWLLPGLLREARQAAEHAPDGPERQRAWRVLAGLYRLAGWALCQYGDDRLAFVAADRAIRAGEQAGDPLVAAAGARVLQQVYLVQGRYDAMVELAEAAGRLVAPGRDATPDRWCVWGSLHMIAALGAARAQDRAEHERLAGLTDAAAAALGAEVSYGGAVIQMGPAMAAVQRVGELADLYEPKRALELAGRLPADPLPTAGRRCYHRIHQAKACFLRRQDGEALGLLAEAERIGPERVRYEPMVREMVRAMLRRRRSAVSPEVRALATRLRVLPA